MAVTEGRHAPAPLPHVVPETARLLAAQPGAFGGHDDSDLNFALHWSWSGGRSDDDSDGSHMMTGAKVEEVLAAHVAAVYRAKAAGFQGVEVWAAYHSLLNQFWTPQSNQRADQ